MILLLAAMAAAQSRTMHVWACAHYGNDAGALATLQPANPTPAANPFKCAPTENTVPDVVNPTGAPLLHASFPFQTITAAINYIPPLPYTSPTTGVTWEYAIVHLTPGTYSRMPPSNVPGSAPDQHNQLYGNGETFPITVPNRVSIQGTSALNTIIDLGPTSPSQPNRTGGPAFTFAGTAASNGAFSYISHLSILGGDVRADPPNQPWLSAIYCAPGDVPCTPTIVNCFLFANGVGVLIDSAPSAPHHVTLINNTIAWNVIGVWNGQIAAPSSVGIADLMLLNNIFDATLPPTLPGEQATCPQKSFPPTWKAWVTNRPLPPPANSPFEGVDVNDVGVVPGLVDFNAYEAGIYNNGLAYPNMSLPATAPDPMVGSPPPPRFDISPYTGSGGGERGVLYVRDLLHNGTPFHVNLGGNGTQSCDFDLSPGDFRLAPAVALAHPIGMPPNLPSVLNPLVDVGISGPFPITMGNGMVLAAPPGSLPLVGLPFPGNGTWPHDLWETDCEGYANPRIVDHPAIPIAQDQYPHIDIGADEVDVLIVAGYRFGTTMFSWLLGAPGVQKDNRYLWMLGPPNGLTAGPSNSIRPWFSGRGPAPPQLPIIWQAPSPENPSYYLWRFASPLGDPSAVPPLPPDPITYYVPRVVDISPHLLPDVHPYHAWPQPGGPIFPTNPVWQHCVFPAYNAWLYIDPTSPIVNPPGAVSVPFGMFNLPGFNWLENVSGQQRAVLWGPFPPAAAPLTVTTFGAWCQNTTGSAQDWDDVQVALATGFSMLGSGSQGAGRVTLEFINQPGGTPYGPPAGSNIQSFLMYQQQ